MSKWQHIIVNGRDELFIGTNLLGRSWDVRGRPDRWGRICGINLSSTLPGLRPLPLFDPKGQ